MAITRTKMQLAIAVMEDLALLNPGETPAAADTSMIIRRYENLLEELRDEQTVYWDENAIPNETFEALVNVVALMVMGAFGKARPFGDQMNSELEAAKRRIKRRVVKPASNTNAGIYDVDY